MSDSIGVVFDMDGVIVHSNPTHKKAIHKFCEEYERYVTEEFLENRVYGRTNKEWIPEVFGDIEPDEIKKLADKKEQLFRDLFTPEDNIVTGIYDFLDDLKSHNVPMAIATSAPVENADYILSRLSIEDYFEVVLDSSHVNVGKPDPEVYLKASKALGKEADNCVVFEDSVSGVQAGLQAGSKVVGVKTTHTAEELKGCHLLIDDFRGLKLEQIS
ncbi:MAG TPA: HAD family phosphatase [Balneolaceae bacterium]|nr:HAD family phosphatase [Balneolaceae bacterium]